MTSTDPRDAGTCAVLDWDSAFFGVRIARFRRARCRGDDLAAIRAECEARAIDCVYVLVDVADAESIGSLLDARALMADTRVTFSGDVRRLLDARAAATAIVTRAATEADLPALVPIASVSHRDTRFYADRRFPRERCDQFYATWIENSCRGFADAVLVAEAPNGGPCGYVTCHRDDAPRGHVGLIAVHESARGKGVGAALLGAAAAWFSENGVETVTVATQLRNVAALRFYERAGLLIARVESWFHFWPRDVHD